MDPRDTSRDAGLRLSVIVPTHERPELLARTLAALERQTLAREAFEVIVVDDGSGEASRARTRSLSPALTLTWVEQPCRGLAAARNAGAARARGAIVHFLDDDVVPAVDLLERHLAAHRTAGRDVAVVGALPYPEEIRPTTFLWYLERSGHFDLYRNPRKYPGGLPPMPPLNGNASLPRGLFARAGGYDEAFRRYGGEDLDLGHRLARLGVPFVYEPRAIGYHHHVKSFERFCRDQEAAGESLIALYRKHPDIRVAKKIDVVEDRLGALPWRKWPMRLVAEATWRAPWLLVLPRAVIRVFGRVWLLRAPLYPFYRWVGHAHYAIGMRRALAARGESS